MKNVLWTIIATLLILATLAGAVHGELIVNKHTNDFAVSSPYANDVKLCACENRADLLTITNTGSFPTTYRPSIIAEQEWYEMSDQQFTLNPGESYDLLIYARPGCGVVGTYTYSVRIASSYGRERVITRTLDVKRCQNLFLTITGGANESNLAQPITYHLTLKNVAEFADTFHLDFGAFNEYADLTKRDYYLLPGEEWALNVTITPPPSLYGDQEIIFTISSEKNKVTERKVEHVTIKNQFDHEIEVPTQAEFCSRVESDYTFRLKNLIDVPNDYDIVVSGPGFIKQETTTLHLDGNEAKNLTLALTPRHGDEGTYTVRIRVKSKLGDIRKERSVEMDIFDCFAYTLGYVELPQASDGAYTDTACCGTKTYELNIRNAGQTEETYNIQVDGPSWFAPEERTIRLKPSENRNVKFTADLPCTDETYEIPVTVWLTRHPEIKESVLFRVNSQTQRTCHAVSVSLAPSIDEEDAVVPVIVKSTGIAGGVYDVSVNGSLYRGVSEPKVTLEPGEEAVLHLQTVANLTDYFNGKYLSELTLSLEQGDNTTITYATPFWTRFAHVHSIVRLWRSIVNYDYGSLGPCVWSIILLTLLALIVAVWLVLWLVNGRVAHPFTKGWLVALRALLIVALVVIAVLFVTTKLPSAQYEAPIEDSSGLVFQWHENSRYTLDLNKYFTDPDKDWLEYTASQPAHVAVIIKGSVATLIPEHNWAGFDKIVFTATDQKGGYDDSPFIVLHVLRREHVTLLQWLNRYCTHLILGLLFVIAALLALLAFLRLAPKRRVPYGVVVEPPKRPAVYTRVSRKGAVEKVSAPVKPGTRFTYVDASGQRRTLGVAEKVVWPEPAKKRAAPKRRTKKPAKRRRMSAAQKAAHSKAMDRALVSSEEHEMKQVLKTHGKRSTQRNIAILRDALAQFKASRYKPKNRAAFYRFLKERNWLRRLRNK